jgi:hypothetical protein
MTKYDGLKQLPNFEVDLSRIYRANEGSSAGKNLGHLKVAVEGSFRGLDPFRTLNQGLIEAYAGPAYGNPKDKRKRYLYKAHQMTEANMVMLAANRPRVSVNTTYRAFRPFAKHFETAINNMLKEIGFEHTVRRWLLDAHFTIGVVKVHRKDSGQVQFENNLWMDPGTPFASNVSLDNFVYDMTARSWDEVKWAGDMYRIPKSDLEEGVKLGMYDAKVAESCKATSKYVQPQDRLASISAGEEVDGDEYEPMVDLADIWIARENRIYTFIVTNVHNFSIKPTPLAVMDWEDDCSPYHILGFNEVPENIMPIGPAVIIDELDRLANNIMRKQSRGAMNQKDLILYRPGDGADTAKNVQRANDGGMLASQDPSALTRVSFNGANPGNSIFLQEVLGMINEMAGNPTAALGLGSQSETASQDEMIHNAVNRKYGQMQSRLLDSTQRLIKSLSLMLWQDELKEVAGEFQPEGLEGYSADATWKPGDREGNFIDYVLSIDVHSMALRTPSSKAQSLLQLMTTVYVPLADQITAQGGMINWAKFNDQLADWMDLSILKDIVTFDGAPPTEEQQPSVSSRGARKPAHTERVYTRKNEASGQAAAMRKQEQMSQWMQSYNSQPTGQTGAA